MPRHDFSHILDDEQTLRTCDPSRMLNLVKGFFLQIQEGIRRSEDFSIDPAGFCDIDTVALFGMGGSGIGGDIVKGCLRHVLPLPFHTFKSASVPAFLTCNSLVILSSYSGNTKEVLDAFARLEGKKPRMLAITSGGDLLQRCRDRNIAHLIIPDGMPPRAALGFSIVYLLRILERCGLISDYLGSLSDMLPKLEGRARLFGSDVPLSENPAKQIAAGLVDAIPLIYSPCEHLHAVALRWRCQMNENAKRMSFVSLLPEDFHNGIMGWEGELAGSGPGGVVFFRDSDEDEDIPEKMSFLESLVARCSLPFFEVRSEGDTILEKVLCLVNLGDFISCYLAFLSHVDPTPLKSIDSLKRVI
jgi:glucose/mannose-6-phosphate isomerase